MDRYFTFTKRVTFAHTQLSRLNLYKIKVVTVKHNTLAINKNMFRNEWVLLRKFKIPNVPT